MYKPYTLILDISYKPTTLVSGRKGFMLYVQNRGIVFDMYPESIFCLRTVKETYKIPSVLRLNILYKQFETTPSRLAIFYRDMFTCGYCGRVCRDSEITIDHILPKSRGGKWSWENLVTCCNECNQKKGNRTPEEAGMKLLHKPYKPDKFEVVYRRNFKYLHPWFIENCLPVWIPQKLLSKVGGRNVESTVY